MRALFSGVTGIRSHQTRMDVIGNNIANVNTIGFKSSRVNFQDVFSQTLSAGSASTTPQQVGLGVGIASVDLNQGAGSFQLTGRDLDLAVEGNGMFVLKGGDGLNIYSRVGNFDWDAAGFLVNPATGARVQGWTADANGVFGNLDTATLGDIQVVKGGVAIAQMTSNAVLGGNLDAGATVPDPPTPPATAPEPNAKTTLTAYDSLGRPHQVTLSFTKTGANAWSWAASGNDGLTTSDTGTLNFNDNGTLQPGSRTGTINLTVDGITAPQVVTLDFSSMTQAFAGDEGSTALVRQADGAPMGTLESVSVDTSGKVFGVFSNGARRSLAQVATANFSNPGGLLKVGGTAFSESTSSGPAAIGAPNMGGRGRLIAGNLEMSNVDLSTEFTNMIMTQRGFQANTRIISAADEMLQDLVNLRR